MISEIKPGTAAAKAHVPQERETLAVFLANSTINGLMAQEVMNMAEVTTTPWYSIFIR